MTDRNDSKTLKPFICGLDIGNPIGHLNLTLVPLRGDGHGQLEYLLAADAIEAGQLIVTEVDEGGNVPELMVTSTADMMILLLDGEELVGAKQNRILNTTVLLPARAKTKIPVSCVEQGRWRHISDEFKPSGCAPPQMRAHKCASVSYNLRAVGRAESDQGEVWDDVACMVEESAIHSPTMAMRDVVQQRRESLDNYLKALDYPTDARGVAVAVNGKFAALDLFDKPETLERIWSRLTGGYVMDAMIRTSDQKRQFTAKGGKALLERISEIVCQSCPTVGVGKDWRFQADDIVGQALIADDVCVHLCAFPNTGRSHRSTRRAGRIASPYTRRRGHNHRNGNV